MSKILFAVFSISIIVFSSCRNNTHVNVDPEKQKSDYQSCSLSIYSPYNCYYKIIFNNEGVGNLKAANRYEKSDNHENDSLISNYSFRIDSADMSKANKLIAEIKASDTVHSNPMFDAYRFEFIIDQKKYIDIYGENKKLNNLLKIILTHIPENAEDKCGIFKLFRKTLLTN